MLFSLSCGTEQQMIVRAGYSYKIQENTTLRRGTKDTRVQQHPGGHVWGCTDGSRAAHSAPRRAALAATAKHLRAGTQGEERKKCLRSTLPARAWALPQTVGHWHLQARSPSPPTLVTGTTILRSASTTPCSMGSGMIFDINSAWGGGGERSRARRALLGRNAAGRASTKPTRAGGRPDPTQLPRLWRRHARPRRGSSPSCPPSHTSENCAASRCASWVQACHALTRSSASTCGMIEQTLRYLHFSLYWWAGQCAPCTGGHAAAATRPCRPPAAAAAAATACACLPTACRQTAAAAAPLCAAAAR